jgi:tetratricopeptide (TPR) repeat protein
MLEIFGLYVILLAAPTTGATTMNTQLPNFDQLWNYDDPAATERKFRDLLPAAQTAGDDSYYLQLLTQIARTQGLQNHFDQAHATLDQVKSKLNDNLAIAKVRYLLERGRVFNSADQSVEALPLFHQAFELASREHLDFYLVDAAHMLGIAETSLEKQLEWNLRALELTEKSDDPRARKWAGPLYNNIGWTYFNLKQYDTALNFFQRGVDFRVKVGATKETRIAKYAVARTLRAMNKIDDALQINQAIYNEAITANQPDGYFAEEIAECLLAKNEREKATPFFAEAYKLLSQDDWLVKHEPQRVARLGELAK